MHARKVILALLTLTFAMPLFANIPATSAAKGPREEDLIFYYYGDVESAYAGLKSGEHDLVAGAGYSNALLPTGLLDTGGYITADLFVGDASSDPNIVAARVAALNMYQFDLNHNWTTADDPGVRSPMTYQSFRQALAWLTPKDWIVDQIKGGFAERIDQPIPYPQRGWANPAYWYPNYPYEYDPAAAASALDDDGFAQGTSPNPYFDAAFPGSAAHIRTYPMDHALAGQDLHPIVVCVRSDDIGRLEAGRRLVDSMRKHGIPVNPIEGPAAVLYDRVMGARSYHIYTGAWTCPRFPTHVCFDYHSNYWYAYGPNYVTGMDASNQPNYPDLDALLDAMRYAATYGESFAACQIAMAYFTEHCITVPLYSDHSYAAWSVNLLSVINMDGYGPINPYTFMSAYKSDGSAIRVGLILPPHAMNLFYSELYTDYTNLDRMTLYGSVDVQPYDLSFDQDGFVTDRVIGMWDDGGTPKTKMTYKYRPDAYFVEPVTGNQLENVNASHVYASIWYDRQLGDGWHWPNVDDVHHLNLLDPYTLEIYFDSYSYWDVYFAQPPIKSFNLLRQGTLSAIRTETIIGFTGPGFLGLSYLPFWVTSITGLGGLTQGTDWEIVRDGPGDGADVYIYKAGKGDIDITYYSAEDAFGFTPGNLPWETAFEGAGAWYATAHTPGVGGFLSLKKNPFYYMETPLLGEINWKRESNGAYKIDLWDVMEVVAWRSAFGSTGTGVPDSNWFPAADIAPKGGKIDIFDIVTLTSRYGQSFDYPP